MVSELVFSSRWKLMLYYRFSNWLFVLFFLGLKFCFGKPLNDTPLSVIQEYRNQIHEEFESEFGKALAILHESNKSKHEEQTTRQDLGSIQ